MYFLPLQLIFAFIAWRKGWRWRVLIPFGVGFALAFAVGILVVVLSGRDPDSIELGKNIALLIGIAVMVALLRMSLRGPRSVKAADGPPSALARDLGAGSNH